MLRTLLSILMTAGAIYITLALFLYFTQSGMLYYPNLPSRELMLTPDRYGLEYEELQLNTRDGLTLHGWFIPARNPRATLLFCHGNAGNISHRMESIAIFHQLGLNVLIFDYRGYGQSEGSPSESGTYLDAEAAWDYLTQQRDIPPDQIILFGRAHCPARGHDMTACPICSFAATKARMDAEARKNAPKKRTSAGKTSRSRKA